MGCSLPGSSVHEILQAIILEWVAMPSSKGSSLSRDQTRVSCISCTAGRFFTASTTWKARNRRDRTIIPSVWRKLHFKEALICDPCARSGEGCYHNPHDREKAKTAQGGSCLCAVAWLLATGRTRLRIRSPDCWSSTLPTAPRWVCIDVIIKESYREYKQNRKTEPFWVYIFFHFLLPNCKPRAWGKS